MRLLLGLVLLAATPAFAADPVPTPNPVPLAERDCSAPRAGPVADPAKTQPMRARRLADLPPANLERAVWRRVDGCPVPVIVRYGVDRREGEPEPRAASQPVPPPVGFSQR